MKILRQKVSKQVYDHIKKMIQTGELQTGDRLPTEAELTKMFEVSRTPIREALSILEASGLIKSTQGGGSIVQEASVTNLLEIPTLERIDIDQVLHLIETRMILEAEAAKLAAIRRSEDDLLTIAQRFHKMHEVVQNDENIGHEEDIAFHSAVVEAAHNPVLQQTMHGISNLYYKAVKFSLKKNVGFYKKRRQVLQEHQAIYENIKDQEPDKAKQAMLIHLQNAKDKLEKYKKANYISAEGV